MVRGKKNSGIDWSNITERRAYRNAYQKKYYREHPDRIKKTKRKYRMNHPRPSRIFHLCQCGNIVEDVPHLRHKNKCRECYQKEMNEYNGNPENFEKIAARQKFSQLIISGKIAREPCQVCGKPAQPHHPDYSKPFQVAWLCASHHGKVHHGKKYHLVIIDYNKFAISKTL